MSSEQAGQGRVSARFAVNIVREGWECLDAHTYVSLPWVGGGRLVQGRAKKRVWYRTRWRPP